MHDTIPELNEEEKKNYIQTIEKEIDSAQKEMIKDVLSEYANHTGYYLECLTHEEDPWKEARKGLNFDEKGEKEIKNETMKRFYQSLYHQE